MIEKKCRVCNIQKVIDNFYIYKSRGTLLYQNICKECDKLRRKQLYKKQREGLDFILKSRETSRIRHSKNPAIFTKEQRRASKLAFKNKSPEKVIAWSKCSMVRTINPSHILHHWSYNIEHCRDFIEVNKIDHLFIHRHLKYDQQVFKYRILLTNELLDTKDKHEKFIMSLGLNVFQLNTTFYVRKRNNKVLQ